MKSRALKIQEVRCHDAWNRLVVFRSLYSQRPQVFESYERASGDITQFVVREHSSYSKRAQNRTRDTGELTEIKNKRSTTEKNTMAHM